MTDEIVAQPLVGVFASPRRVEAQFVSDTGFGKLMAGQRKIVEDVDGPPEVLPLSESNENQREALGFGLVETIANAIAKLVFGVRGPGIALGIAFDGERTGDGRGVVEPRIPDLCSSLETALRGRNVRLAEPLHGILVAGEAWALGEAASPMGALPDRTRGLVVMWDQSVAFAERQVNGMVHARVEPRGAMLDLGFRGLEEIRASRRARGDRLLVAARRRDDAVLRLLVEAAGAIGKRAGELVAASLEGSDTPIERVVLGGEIGRASLDERIDRRCGEAFRSGLFGALQRTYASTDTESTDPSEPELFHVSREGAACVIGAASAARNGPHATALERRPGR